MEQVQVQDEASPESQEYIDAMAAKGEQAVNAGKTHNEQDVQPKPEGIPDKFYNPSTGEVDYQAMAKSYTELEKMKGKAQEAKPEESTDQPAEEPQNVDAAEKAVSNAGLDFGSLSEEYANEGTLSAKSYESLEKAGIPKEIVDQYIAGQQAAAAQAKASAHSLTNGEEGYNAMIGWARANLSPAEINAYNQSVNVADAGIREMAVRGLWSRYNADSGNEGKLIQGKSTQGQPQARYESNAQLRADMSDPRYKADPAFRKAVEAKLANSSIF